MASSLRPARALLMASTVAVALGVGGAAHAQSAQDKATAEALFTDARKALEAGNFADACPKLASSERLDPAIGTALFLGECYERTGKAASAWAMFREAQDLAHKRSDKREELAQKRADRLEPSKLTIAVAPGAQIAGLEIERDGVVLSSSLIGFATPLDGGPHTVRVTAPGKKAFEQTVQLAEQKGNVTVTVPALEDARSATPVTPPPSAVVAPPPRQPVPSPAPEPTSPSQRDGSGQRFAGLVVMGVGVVGVGLGGVFGAMAGSDWHASNTDGKCDANSTRCFDPSGPGLRSSAQTEALVSTIAFVGGGAALVGGAVLFFIAPKARGGVQVAPTLGGLLVRTTF